MQVSYSKNVGLHAKSSQSMHNVPQALLQVQGVQTAEIYVADLAAPTPAAPTSKNLVTRKIL